MNYQQHFRQLTKLVWFQVLLTTTILLLGRVVMFTDFVDFSQLAGRNADLWRMVITGLRYDLRVTAIAFAPLYLFGLIFACHPMTWRALKAAAPLYSALITFLIAAVTISNYFYYQTYHNHFDIFMFGFFEDDTKAVVANMWQDYPIFKCTILSALAALLSGMLAKKIIVSERIISPWKTLPATVYGLISIVIFVIAARGSIGTFPLRQANAQVSDLVVLNKLTPNGFMAIDWALKARKQDAKFEDVALEKGLSLLEDTIDDNDLYSQTEVNPYLEDTKPNVILAVMESMGSNMLAFDDPATNDMLGSLRQHFESDYLFEHFLPADNGTAPSLAQIMFNSPIPSISQSSVQSLTLDGTAFKPYKDAGYKIVFVSPGNMAWRNYSGYLPIQGVDQVVDQNTLLNTYPESAQYMTDWGLPDDVAFKYTQKLLADEQGPLFIIMLSVTNHPPYVTPDYYDAYPTHVNDDYRERAGQGQIAPEGIQSTFQYSADSLGRFISHIKNENQKDQSRPTVIAATGDHQMRRIEAKMPQEVYLDKGVPFYLYIPEKLHQHLDITYEPQRIGAHKDIMPTLFSVSLSNATYLNVGGRNLMANQDDPNKAFGVNTKVWINNDGVVSLEEPMRFYPWNKNSLYLEPQSAAAVPDDVKQKISAYHELMKWQLNYRVMQAKE